MLAHVGFMLVMFALCWLMLALRWLMLDQVGSSWLMLVQVGTSWPQDASMLAQDAQDGLPRSPKGQISSIFLSKIAHFGTPRILKILKKAFVL